MPIPTSTVRWTTALAVSGLTATGLAVASPARAAASRTIGRDLDARMTSTHAHPRAHGHVEYDVDRSGREFEMRLAGVKGLAGHRVTVRVHGDVVGKATVNRYGIAHLERKSGVPAMSAGDVVKVRIGSGSLVSSGVLHPETDSDAAGRPDTGD